MATQLKEQKALVRRAIKGAFDDGEPEVLAELCTADFVHHTALRDDVEGPDKFVAFARGLHESFDDLTFEIRSLLTEDNEVAVRGAASGIHVGAFQGVPPTEESVTWQSYVFARIKDGKMAETWVLSDVMGLLEQLDTVPDAG